MSLSAAVRVGTLVAALACPPATAWAQSSRESDGQRRAEEEAFREREREIERSKRQPLEPLRPRRKDPGPAPKREMTEEHRRRLYPSPEERNRYAAFLRHPRTGLARMSPLVECMKDPRVVRVGGSCQDAIPPVPGGGAFYSFVSGGHQSVRLADLWLKDGSLRAGFAGGVFGVLTALGDVPIESVGIETPGVGHLSEFDPPTSLVEAQRRYREYEDGVTAAGRAYGVAAPARSDTTYAIRSITYRGTKYDGLRRDGDVLVAFRVVGKTADGSITFVWRELRRREGPRFSP